MSLYYYQLSIEYSPTWIRPNLIMRNKFISAILPLVTLFPLGCQATAEQEPPPPPMETAELFTQAELDQMLAPIALYPDALLSQVLMAATYPIEVIEASRWSKETKLEGEEAVNSAQEQNWDISIKSLVAFPDLIQLMDEQLTWTRRLGDAFLLQEGQVMETVQMLRRRSLDEGNLDSLEHLVVRDEGEVIVVEPREVEVVYVPYYNTRYVYGDWWWYDYPPVYWHYPRYPFNHIGFRWSIGWRVSSRFYFSFCDWYHWDIVLHHHRWNHGRHQRPTRSDIHYDRDRGGRPGHADGPDHDRRPGGRDAVVNLPERETLEDIKTWSHSPYHRRGVEYRGDIRTNQSDRTNAVDLSTVSRTSTASQAQRSNLKREILSRTSTRRADTTPSTPVTRTLPSMSNRSSRGDSGSHSVNSATAPTSDTSQASSSRSDRLSSESRSRTAPPTSRTRIANTTRPDTPTPVPSSSSRSYERSSPGTSGSVSPPTSRSYSSGSSNRSSPPSTSSSRSYSRSSSPPATSSGSSRSSSPPATSSGSSRSSSSPAASSPSYSRSSSPSSSSSRSVASSSSSGSSRAPIRSSQSSSRSIRPVPDGDR